MAVRRYRPINYPVGAAASVAWGNITGTLSNQSDLQTELNTKLVNIVEDTSPQLGANLDTNGYTIQLDNSKYLQGLELDGVTVVDLIGVNSSDWIEVGVSSNNVQYDGALHKFSADMELHGGNDLRIYDSGNTDYIGLSHDGTDAVANFSNTTDFRFETGLSRSVVFEGQTIDHWHDHAEGSGGDAIRHLVYPRGGFFSSNSANQNGAILITLPNTAGINNMRNMVIRGYDYVGTRGAWAIAIGGYDYPTTDTWFNVSADVIQGNPPFDVVYFQTDSVTTQQYIQLGDVTDTNNMQYPKIWIETDSVGYSDQSNANLADGWSIALSTSIGNRQNAYTRALLSRYSSGANHYTFDAGGEVDYVYWNNIGAAMVLHDGADLFIYDTTDTDYISFNDTGAQAQISTNNNDLFLRPGGVPAVRITTAGALRVQDTATGNDYGAFSHDGTDFLTAFTNTTDWYVTGLNALRIESGSSEGLYLRGANPSIRFSDTTASAYDYWVHVNSNYFYVLCDRDNSGSWESPHPLLLDGVNDVGYLFGDKIPTVATNETITSTWTFSSRLTTSGGILCGAKDADFAYGIHGGYSDVSTSTFGATIWAIDTSWSGGAAAANSSSASVYGIRWLRASHTDANGTYAGEGLYQFVNGTIYNAIGDQGAMFRHVYPATAATYNLGAAANRWNNLHVSNIEFAGQTDTTLTRKAAGVLGVENYAVFRQAATGYTSAEITISSAAASGGDNGDIWMKYA